MADAFAAGFAAGRDLCRKELNAEEVEEREAVTALRQTWVVVEAQKYISKQWVEQKARYDKEQEA